METEQRTRGKQTAAGEGSQSMISEGGEWQEVELEVSMSAKNIEVVNLNVLVCSISSSSKYM